MNKVLSFRWGFLAAAVLVIFSSGCAEAQKDKSGAGAASRSMADYSAKDFHANMKEPGAIILDVRTPEEVSRGIIAGAQVIDFNSADFRSRVAALDHNAPVYVYCAAGGRSSKAKKIMVDMGFRSVHNLEGGIDGWRAAGLPVERKK